MGGVLLIFLFNSIIFVIGFLWAITFFGFNYNNNIDCKEKFDIYECGFKSINNFKIELNYSTVIISMFLVLYEFEMFLFVPFFFNVKVWNIVNVTVLTMYIYFINMTIWIDVKFNALKWIF